MLFCCNLPFRSLGISRQQVLKDFIPFWVQNLYWLSPECFFLWWKMAEKKLEQISGKIHVSFPYVLQLLQLKQNPSVFLFYLHHTPNGRCSSGSRRGKVWKGHVTCSLSPYNTLSINIWHITPEVKGRHYAKDMLYSRPYPTCIYFYKM